MANLPATTAALPALTEDDLALMASSSEHAPTFDAKQLMTPYLTLVQGMSPYVKRNDPAYIEAAREGDIIDTLTLKIRAEALVVPVLYETHYTEWKPNRGGMVKQWFTDDSGYKAASGDYGMRVTAEGNEINETQTFYCLLIEGAVAMPVVVALAGSQAKKARRWNSLIGLVEIQGPNGTSFTPPIYGKAYKLTSVSETATTKTGQQATFAGWKIEPDVMTLQLPNGRSIFAKAKLFRESLDRGEGRPAPPTHEAGDAVPAARPASANQAAPSASDTDEIPFD